MSLRLQILCPAVMLSDCFKILMLSAVFHLYDSSGQKKGHSLGGCKRLGRANWRAIGQCRETAASSIHGKSVIWQLVELSEAGGY